MADIYKPFSLLWVNNTYLKVKNGQSGEQPP